MQEQKLREQELLEIPPRPINKSKWPAGLRSISLEELDALAVDKEDMIYWHGQPVQMRRRIELRSWELILLALATFGTLLQGIAAMFPFIPREIASALGLSSG